MTSVLLIDDEAEAVLSLSRALTARDNSLQVDAVSLSGRAKEMLCRKDYQVVVLDLSLDPRLGVESGFGLLQDILSEHPEIRIIVLTGHSSVENGVPALKMGASHFLEKPPDITHLLVLIKDCVSQAELFKAWQSGTQGAGGFFLNKNLAGSSEAVQRLREELNFVASTNQAVLLLGETGTGKTLCASLIHALSPRASARFVTYTPAYVNSDLLNSELYGHQKGAFTGANENRNGLLREADRGTFFMDEVDELPHDLQVSLLKVLHSSTFRALGSNREENSDFRLITASNRAEEDLIKSGKLREDFFHRIAHKIIRIPSLRERGQDITEISQGILDNLNLKENLQVYSAEAEALDRLMSYDWPGNIRELEAVLTGAACFAGYKGRSVILADDLNFRNSKPAADQGFHKKVEDYKYSLVREALSRTANNQLQAAKLLGLDRSCLRRILNNKAAE